MKPIKQIRLFVSYDFSRPCCNKIRFLKHLGVHWASRKGIEVNPQLSLDERFSRFDKKQATWKSNSFFEQVKSLR